MEDRHRDIGLFRYSLAREAGDPQLSKADRGALVRALAAMDHAGPDGRRVRVGRSTLDRWIRTWRAGGFEALCPSPRRAEPHTPPAVLDLAASLKREVPKRTAAQVLRVMTEAGTTPCPSERTIQRHFARLGLNVRPDGSPPQAYGRYEAQARNDRWLGDAMHGPQVGGHKAYLLAFLDDHSRLLPGYRWCSSEDTIRMEQTLRAALSARGVPKVLLVDHGSAYRDAQLHRACAVLGIRLVHARPYTPTTKGKVERFFETARSGFVVELEARGVADLAELNRLFGAWVETVYHRRRHSETGATPLERFMAPGPPELPSATLLHEAFLWSELRTVSKSATVSLHANSFEVDAALVGRRVELVFDPFDMTAIEVRFAGRPMGLAVPIKIAAHTHPKARPEAQPAPAPTGIDYLGLVDRRREAELLGRPIGYAAMSEDNESDHDDHEHTGDEEDLAP